MMAFVAGIGLGRVASAQRAAVACAPRQSVRHVRSSRPLMMAEIAKGVEFDTIAREWRFKWSTDNDKKSLATAQEALTEVLPKLKALDGVKDVQRIVCGGCLDFKVITAVAADKYGDWEAKKFEPEESFLAKVGTIDGVSQVETQTFTRAFM